MAGNENSGHRLFTPEQMAAMFEAYKHAPICADSGKPSISFMSTQFHVCRKTMRRLRDVNRWEERRLEHVERVRRKAEEKAVRADAEVVTRFQNLERAGLNYQKNRMVKGPDGKYVLPCKIPELVALSRHVVYLTGRDDPETPGTGGERVQVVLNLGNNGMWRENGNSGSGSADPQG